jgi:UDP-hydrolysing UDP-N-acetyl-D-glucosamine 2-epimerase
VMRAIQEHPKLDLSVVCSGTMLLERFGQVENIVKSDGFEISGRIYMELEGSVPTTMAKSVGFGTVEFATELKRLDPDILLIIGDRYEALAAVIAGAYQNIPIAHIQGGEVSGSIDESARHAITKFSQYHFPATQRAAEYIIRMGENPDYVFNYGCPAGDYIIPLDADLPEDIFFSTGVGADFSPQDPFLLVLFHPVTTEFGEEGKQVEELLHALDVLEYPTVWLWPNIDAGSDHISTVLRRYREHKGDKWLRLVKNFEPTVFQKILKKCACAVGNSSSFVRDSTFSGTPVVLIGDRQTGRETGENLIPVLNEDSTSFLKAIKKQLDHGRYSLSSLYGKGNASEKIADTLANLKLYTQKQLHYIQSNTDHEAN